MKLNDIDDLTPADYNPRDITDAASDGLAESIQRFGDVSGITYNTRTKRLVCGHQRVAQLRKLGAQLVRGALQLANGDRFPVRIVDWSEAEEKAANVSANNPHIAGTFTSELDSLLDEICGTMGNEVFVGLALDVLRDDMPTSSEWDAALDGPTGDREDGDKMQISFIFTAEQKAIVEAAMRVAKGDAEKGATNGALLATIARGYCDQR